MSPKITSAYEFRIRQRWEAIEPSLIIYLKSRPSGIDFPTRIAQYRELHRAIMIRAITVGLTFRAVRLYSLDDPTISEDERDTRFAKADALRRKYPGRTPKLGRENCKRPQAILPGDI